MIGALLLLATDLCAVGDGLAVATDAGLAVDGRAFGEARPIMALAASPDGRWLAEAGGLAGEHGTLRLWDVASATLRWERQVHDDVIYDVAWSPDGATLWTASGDHTVGGFAADGSTDADRFLRGHSDQVLCLAVAPDGTLASGSLDRSVRIWRDGEPERALASHAGRVTALAFSPDGSQLASGAADRTVRLWQHELGRLRRIVREQGGVVTALVWTDERLLSASSDGAVRELDPLRAQVASVTPRHDDWIRALVWRDGGLVTLDASGVLRAD